MKSSIDKAKKELSDPQKTSFVIVMIPELMAVYETERLLNSLISFEIPVQNLIVNQIVPENKGCEYCQARRAIQLKHLKEIQSLYAEDYNLIEMEERSFEVRKIENLRKFADILIENHN